MYPDVWLEIIPIADHRFCFDSKNHDHLRYRRFKGGPKIFSSARGDRLRDATLPLGLASNDLSQGVIGAGTHLTFGTLEEFRSSRSHANPKVNSPSSSGRIRKRVVNSLSDGRKRLPSESMLEVLDD